MVLFFYDLLSPIHRYLGAYSMHQFYRTLDCKMHQFDKTLNCKMPLGLHCYAKY